MDASADALRVMADRSTLSRRALAAAVGRSPSYISTLMAQGSPVGLPVLAAVARATGATITLTLSDGAAIDLTDAGADAWAYPIDRARAWRESQAHAPASPAPPTA